MPGNPALNIHSLASLCEVLDNMGYKTSVHPTKIQAVQKGSCMETDQSSEFIGAHVRNM